MRLLYIYIDPYLPLACGRGPCGLTLANDPGPAVMAGFKRMEFVTLQGCLRYQIKGSRKFSKGHCQRHHPNRVVGNHHGGLPKGTTQWPLREPPLIWPVRSAPARETDCGLCTSHGRVGYPTLASLARAHTYIYASTLPGRRQTCRPSRRTTPRPSRSWRPSLRSIMLR